MSAGIQIIDPEERFQLELDGASLTLRRIDSGTMAALERRCPGHKEPELKDEVLDYILLDWQEVKSPLTGEDVACSRENKFRLPSAVKARILLAAGASRAEDSRMKAD